MCPLGGTTGIPLPAQNLIEPTVIALLAAVHWAAQLRKSRLRLVGTFSYYCSDRVRYPIRKVLLRHYSGCFPASRQKSPAAIYGVVCVIYGTCTEQLILLLKF